MQVAAYVLAGLIGLAAPPSAPRGPATRGCPADFERFDQGPVEAGPLRLLFVACVDLGSGQVGHEDPLLSPDGRSVARWQNGSPAPIDIARIGRPGRVSVPARVTFRNFALFGGDFGTAPDALAWASDSRSLWTVRQRVASPGGWAHGGLVPVSIGRDGAVRDLPALRHPAGQLDAILWAGGRGLAIAQFGTRGGSYRPSHGDPAPTLAMVDAARGRVLEELPAARIAGLTERVRAEIAMASGATATILRDGRIRAVLQFGRWGERPAGTPPDRERIVHPGMWLVWTQGQAPRIWPAPFPDDRHNPLALSPDGSKLLVVRPLQPDGVQTDCRIPCRRPPPPPPTPVSGPVAELIDIASRRVLWRVPARAAQFWRQSAPPVISQDGRHALIELPPEGDRAPIALIDMRTGRIVQRIAPFHIWTYKHSFGFTAGGRRAWVSVGDEILVYEVRRR